MSELTKWYQDFINEESVIVGIPKSETESDEHEDKEEESQETTITVNFKEQDNVEKEDSNIVLKMRTILKKMNFLSLQYLDLNEPYTNEVNMRSEIKKALEILQKELGNCIAEL